MNHDNSCFDCAAPINRQTEPEGVIYLRVKLKPGKYGERAVCSDCFDRRAPKKHQAVRWRWDMNR